MEQHKILAGKEKPLLLFSALDWGLGHVTRSIPLIRQFQEQGWEVVVACDSIQKEIFQTEIYGLRFAQLPGYSIRYSTSRTGTKLKLLLQIPKILTKINKENIWLRQFISKNAVNMVVSDNRYGFWTGSAPSIFITHQLRVITGLGFWCDHIVQRFLYRFINKFSECWIPDNETDGLAGKLSHPQYKPKVPVKYIGLLSRLQQCAPGPYKHKYCIILSGPEPQRTILESIVAAEFNNTQDTIIIGGVPGVNYLSSPELNKIICLSEIIICRSGYTSMMELIGLNKKIIVVPTPGQTEQEYLATYLSDKKHVIVINQNSFTLENVRKVSAW